MKQTSIKPFYFFSAMLLLVFTLNLAGSKKCQNGNPLEYRAKYWIKQGSPVMGGFQWTSPKRLDIGNGFKVEAHPIVPYRVTMGINLYVYGPGLPASGRLVAWSWANKQCMGIKKVTAKSGASTYTIEFYGGSTHQPAAPGEHEAAWTMCFNGPYEVIRLNLPKLGPVWQIDWETLSAQIKHCSDRPDCGASVDPAKAKLKLGINSLREFRAREDVMEFCKGLAVELQLILNLVKDAGKQLAEANKSKSAQDRKELRKNAREQLKGASEITLAARKMLQEFKRHLKGKGEKTRHRRE